MCCCHDDCDVDDDEVVVDGIDNGDVATGPRTGSVQTVEMCPNSLSPRPRHQTKLLRRPKSWPHRLTFRSDLYHLSFARACSLQLLEYIASSRLTHKALLCCCHFMPLMWNNTGMRNYISEKNHL